MVIQKLQGKPHMEAKNESMLVKGVPEWHKSK